LHECQVLDWFYDQAPNYAKGVLKFQQFPKLLVLNNGTLKTSTS